MNERIRELSKQAGEFATTRHPVSNIVLSVNSEKFEEKFAELIVAECLDACGRANEIRHFVPPTQEQVVLSCMREIETTFRS